jgi:hypothetical protein
MGLQIINFTDSADEHYVIGTLLVDESDLNEVSLGILVCDYKKDNPEYNWTDFLGYLDSKNIPYMVIHPEVVEF